MGNAEMSSVCFCNEELGASRFLAHWPKSDFDPLGISKNYNIKTS